MRLRAIGFWCSVRDESPSLPDPRDFLDPDWPADARAIVAGYLTDARRVRFQMGYSTCRLCGELVGTFAHTDGTYLWPTGLAHYVQEHSLRPPQEFLEHVERELDLEDSSERDDGWWCMQRATGTQRAWTRWRVELAPGTSSAELISRVEQTLGRDPHIERLGRGLNEHGVGYLPDSMGGVEICECIGRLGLGCTITKELVAAGVLRA